MIKYRALLWVLIVVMMAVIFGFSSQTSEKSSALSSAVAEEQSVIISKISDSGISAVDDFIKKNIRSLAHCVLYFWLAILVFTQCRLYKINPVFAFVIAVGCCFLYGLSDEFHQKFVEGRNSRIEDVYADSFGACIGAGLSVVSEKLCRLFKGAGK